MNETDSNRRVVDLLMEALDLEGDERQRFLDEVCAGDPELRRELEELLAEEALLDDRFLEVPAIAGLVETPQVANGETPAEELLPAPKQLGPYRIVKTLGRGGMGVVYLGEQVQPVRRRVALKVIDAIHEPQRLQTIGEIYTKMALFESAEEVIAEALEIRRAELAEDHPDVLESMNELGVIYRRQGRLDEAEPLLRRVLAAREAEAARGDVHREVADTLLELGELAHRRGRAGEARELLRRAHAIYAATLPPDHPDLRRAAAALAGLGPA